MSFVFDTTRTILSPYTTASEHISTTTVYIYEILPYLFTIPVDSSAFVPTKFTEILNRTRAFTKLREITTVPEVSSNDVVPRARCFPVKRIRKSADRKWPALGTINERKKRPNDGGTDSFPYVFRRLWRNTFVYPRWRKCIFNVDHIF